METILIILRNAIHFAKNQVAVLLVVLLCLNDTTILNDSNVKLLVEGLNIIIAGGTGPIGKEVASQLKSHQITLLCRNSYLASAPNRVTQDFGYAGPSFLAKNKHVKLRDYDGGDLLDIVGQDWMGWQQETLPEADVILHCAGGFTEQREMVCERIIREASTFCKKKSVCHITVNPSGSLLKFLSPGLTERKLERISLCEEMVSANTAQHTLIRSDERNIKDVCTQIVHAIEKL